MEDVILGGLDSYEFLLKCCDNIIREFFSRTFFVVGFRRTHEPSLSRPSIFELYSEVSKKTVASLLSAAKMTVVELDRTRVKAVFSSLDVLGTGNYCTEMSLDYFKSNSISAPLGSAFIEDSTTVIICYLGIIFRATAELSPLEDDCLGIIWLG